MQVEKQSFTLFSCFFWLTNFSILFLITTSIDAISIAKFGCPTKCGNVTIPYPFGIGLDGYCSLSPAYNIYCNTSFVPHKPFLSSTITGQLEIIQISNNGIMRIRNNISIKCYQQGKVLQSKSNGIATINLTNLPLVVSDTANKFTAIGCDEVAVIADGNGHASGCAAMCTSLQNAVEYNKSCLGIGCCQTITIPKGLTTSYVTSLGSMFNHVNVSDFNSCGAAFLAEHDKFTFDVDDLSDTHTKFMNRVMENVPVVLDWFVGVNETCHQAQKTSSRSGYACQDNTNCTDFVAGSTLGYRCSCLPGYQGNPYLSPGCIDIDECGDNSRNSCSHICINTGGSYVCSCPKGHYGDGLKNGTRCSSKRSQAFLKISLGISLGFLILLVLVSWIYFTTKKRKLTRLRESFFEKNGGMLLTRELSSNGGTMESSKIFTSDELKIATNNYHDNCILGKGGYGTVYKGILKDGREVAIKKSIVADKTQVEQFINEVVILTQINHRNVVKLLGCCLETEVPLLVYEFISNGTLFEHIHRNKGITSWLTWENCIKLASEAANALSYLHSAASTPVIHRDVKSTNILLDKSYTAKISDFGASRLIPIDQTQVTTLVQGTLGYLDPEYLQTSLLTEKSDVYSFGVLLTELLTREKPLSLDRSLEERNLALYFLLAMKEDRLMDIVDSQLVSEASEEQLITLANLVKKCLNVQGEDRPTMKEVALELEGLKQQNGHPWVKQNHEETNTILGGQQDIIADYSNNHNWNTSTIEITGQHAMEIIMVSELNHPR
ncbi:Wall-associated receptor kinase 2 [Bienertia sinuspersici]